MADVRSAIVLSSVTIRNFRSLEHVQIRLGPLTALIGPNGAGKSSILRAIDIVQGSRWPTLGSFRIPQDFTNRDEGLDLLIQVGLDPPYPFKDKLSKVHPVKGIRLDCKPYRRNTAKGSVGDLHVELTPRDASGGIPVVAVSMKQGQKPDFGPLHAVTRDMRDANRVLFIDHRRSVAQHMPWMRGSPLAEILAPARKQLRDEHPSGRSYQEEFRDRYEQAMEALRTPVVQQVEEVISETTKRTLGFLGSEVIQDVEVGFGFADPANPLSSWRLVYREAGMEVPGEDLGMGVQSAIVVGVFEALRQLGGKIGTVLIEEPEMYLHPQAQRFFYGLLCELADSGQAQVIYSTHSPVFADVGRFEGIRLVRREPGASSTVSAVEEPDDLSYLAAKRDAQKLLGFAAASSEAFFARRVLLVEGRADALAVRLAIKSLGLPDPDAEDLAVIECDGKAGIPFMARLCRALAIPFVVLHDEDIRHVPEDQDSNRAKRQRERNDAAVRKNAEIAETAGTGKVFIARPSLEEELDISSEADDKPRRVAEEIARRSTEQLPQCLSNAVKALFSQA